MTLIHCYEDVEQGSLDIVWIMLDDEEFGTPDWNGFCWNEGGFWIEVQFRNLLCT
jgi:hypothetical protein